MRMRTHGERGRERERERGREGGRGGGGGPVDRPYSVDVACFWFMFLTAQPPRPET